MDLGKLFLKGSNPLGTYEDYVQNQKVDTFKARLERKGYHHIQLLGYDKTLSSVATLESIRILLALFTSCDLQKSGSWIKGQLSGSLAVSVLINTCQKVFEVKLKYYDKQQMNVCQSSGLKLASRSLDKYDEIRLNIQKKPTYKG